MIFEQCFSSYGGHFSAPRAKPFATKTAPSRTKAIGLHQMLSLDSDLFVSPSKRSTNKIKAPVANNRDFGPTALLLACKEIHEPALEVSLKTITTLFTSPKEFEDFWRHHKKQGTANFVRNIAFDLRKTRSLRAYALPMAKLGFRETKVENIELLMAEHSESENCALNHFSDRENLILDFNVMSRLLPKDLKQFSTRIPEYERLLQTTLDRITCSVCMQLLFYTWRGDPDKPAYSGHTCDPALTPAAFEQLSSDEQHALVKYCGHYQPGRLAPGPVGIGYLMLNDFYTSRIEYLDWKAQCLFNELLASLWERVRAGDSSVAPPALLDIPMAAEEDDAILVPSASRWWET